MLPGQVERGPDLDDLLHPRGSNEIPLVVVSVRQSTPDQSIKVRKTSPGLVLPDLVDNRSMAGEEELGPSPPDGLLISTDSWEL